ncbi:MAG TPA: ImmA/IrrE family metallo-endopeptidase [bacterium]|nr:ImmA/IrrE family metallo-endopeptidase [bacterium]
MIALDVEFLTDDRIKAIAEQFRSRLEIKIIPVPIDAIIERELGIDIIPIPGLQKAFEIEGFITSDFSSIYMDDYMFDKKYYFRYRYTLAHEIGHMILHKKYFKNHIFQSIDEWKTFIAELDPRDHSKMEYQSYVFGGLLLAPPKELAELYSAQLIETSSLVDQAKRSGLARNDYLEYAIEHMANALSPSFEVSIDVIKKRIRADHLDELVP